MRYDRTARWIARHLPRRVVYWAAITVWARATTGPWDGTVASSLTMADAVARWES